MRRYLPTIILSSFVSLTLRAGDNTAALQQWQADAAHPLPVDDRTMLHLLDALQTLEQGGARVLLSYRALDVEQIGHVYEGLLDHTALRITDTALGLGGKLEPELTLSQLDEKCMAPA